MTSNELKKRFKRSAGNIMNRRRENKSMKKMKSCLRWDDSIELLLILCTVFSHKITCLPGIVFHMEPHRNTPILFKNPSKNKEVTPDRANE